MKTTADYLNTLPQVGVIAWIGLSTGHRSAIQSVAESRATEGTGLDGDYHAKSGRSHRQVTLIQYEHLAVVASCAGIPRVEPECLRRNVCVKGINLLALKDRRFRLGDAVFEGTGPCDPCSRMEEVLGPGGLNAMRGHGGITARVLTTGTIRLGDTVGLLPSTE